jgi:hypothetical protein
MKRIRSHLFGIDQGEHIMFSDYENDGKMWSGNGTRQRKKTIVFSEPFEAPPSVHVSMSLMDLDKETNVRSDVLAKNISTTGFDLIFRTRATHASPVCAYPGSPWAVCAMMMSGT